MNDPFRYTPSTITSAPCLNKSGLAPTNLTGNLDIPSLILKFTSNLLDSDITIELSATIPPKRTRSVLLKSNISFIEINFTYALSFTGFIEDQNIQKVNTNESPTTERITLYF